MLRPPIEAIHPARVPAIPDAMPGGILYQAKLDGWRALAFIDADHVVLQSRSGKILTDQFPEILPALTSRPAGTVLDGEIVAWRDGAFDFGSLARSPRARQRTGVAISYIAFDLLCENGRDIRKILLEARWPRLLTALQDTPEQLQPVLATRDRSEAESWMRLLAPLGMEGLVCKALASPYRNTPGVWVKYRHSDTVDARLIGTVGPAGHTHSARIRLPDGRELTTIALTRAHAAAVTKALANRPANAPDPIVEVQVSGDRHPRARFVRLRPDE